MYQEMSLRFYRAGETGFELYTHYLYEKIFGEAFVRRAAPYLEKMRLAFYERYRHRVHSLVRFTEAQDPVLRPARRRICRVFAPIKDADLDPRRATRTASSCPRSSARSPISCRPPDSSS